MFELNLAAFHLKVLIALHAGDFFDKVSGFTDIAGGSPGRHANL